MYKEKSKLHTRQRTHIQGNLRTLALDVTGQCNMRCPHCYAEPFFNRKDLELGVLYDVFDEAYDMGVFHYVLQGGEAILKWKRLTDIIKHIYPEETYITVVSNGWELDNETILALKDIGVDKIALSLDSGIPETHDSNRRAGSFDRVVKAIDNIIDTGLQVSVSTVITKGFTQSDDFRALLALATEKQIRIDTQIVMPIGAFEGRTDLLVEKSDLDRLREINQTFPKTRFDELPIKRDVYAGDDEYCPAGTEFMGINSEGEVFPCNFLQFSLGNIRHKSLRTMRAQLLQSNWFCKKHPVCLCGEDKEFINTYIVPNKGNEKPIDAIKAFNLTDL